MRGLLVKEIKATGVTILDVSPLAEKLERVTYKDGTPDFWHIRDTVQNLQYISEDTRDLLVMMNAFRNLETGNWEIEDLTMQPSQRASYDLQLAEARKRVATAPQEAASQLIQSCAISYDLKDIIEIAMVCDNCMTFTVRPGDFALMLPCSKELNGSDILRPEGEPYPDKPFVFRQKPTPMANAQRIDTEYLPWGHELGFIRSIYVRYNVNHERPDLWTLFIGVDEFHVLTPSKGVTVRDEHVKEDYGFNLGLLFPEKFPEDRSPDGLIWIECVHEGKRLLDVFPMSPDAGRNAGEHLRYSPSQIRQLQSLERDRRENWHDIMLAHGFVSTEFFMTKVQFNLDILRRRAELNGDFLSWHYDPKDGKSHPSIDQRETPESPCKA